MIARVRENLSMLVRIDAQMWTFAPLRRVLFILSSLVRVQMYVTHLPVYGAASAHRWHLCKGTGYLDMAPSSFWV